MPLAAHQRPRAAPDAAAGQPRPDRGTAGQAAAAIPNLAMRTTFIVGFPGETEAEFEELVEFVRESTFERAGVFPYSFEPGTPATRLDGHLPEEVKQERRDRLMAVQQEVAFDWSRQPGRQGARGDRRRPRPRSAQPRAGPQLRRRSGHRRRWCASRARDCTPATWCA